MVNSKKIVGHKSSKSKEIELQYEGVVFFSQ